jgi:hypothetical protein
MFHLVQPLPLPGIPLEIAGKTRARRSSGRHGGRQTVVQENIASPPDQKVAANAQVSAVCQRRAAILS